MNQPETHKTRREKNYIFHIWSELVYEEKGGKLLLSLKCYKVFEYFCFLFLSLRFFSRRLMLRKNLWEINENLAQRSSGFFFERINLNEHLMFYKPKQRRKGRKSWSWQNVEGNTGSEK